MTYWDFNYMFKISTFDNEYQLLNQDINPFFPLEGNRRDYSVNYVASQSSLLHPQ